MIDPYELLREVIVSGRSFDDPSVRYVEAQLSRELLFDIAKCLNEQECCAVNNHWQDITDDHRDGWYWCESLDDDAPPQLLRSYKWMWFQIDRERLVDSYETPRVWERWTTGGWVPLVGRVCPISPRPQS